MSGGEHYRRPKNRFVAEFIGETNHFAVTIERVEGGRALARTAEGLELVLAAGAVRAGDRALAVLRPADFTLAERGIAATVTRAVYLGSDLHLFVQPATGGPEISVTTRDSADAPQVGSPVHLVYDADAPHVLDAA